MRIFIYILSILALTSCTALEGSKSTRADGPGLDKKHAKLRSKAVKNITYNLKFDLTQAEKYTGSVEVEFDLKRKIPLTLDFVGGEVFELSVNGTQIEKPEYNGFFIRIPKKEINKGANTIEVSFAHPYSKNGQGLYRYVDPVDKRVYLYTDFEPYDANQLFPCFDQPNLKATYASKVKTPAKWEVITSTRESNKMEQGDGTLMWTFPESEKFSSYIYSLHAGEYKIWESEVKTPNHVIPLRLFARKSIAKHVKINDWFVPTQQGFVYFEEYFGTPYPYKKYDQVIAPDFNLGAMENVAAVTFNESRYVKRGKKLKKDRRALAEVIFHEMAHMWFGNLVTMNWWNDLWLNESFATYMASKAMVEATSEYKDNWMAFFKRRKQSAYWADQLVTTHPIETKVPSTEEAFTVFDAISYGKGASVLKQMAYYMGEENFKSGIQRYFQTHAEKNTELKDFVKAMTKSTKKNMKKWQRKWLQKASVNTVEMEVECDDQIIETLKLKQGNLEGYPTIRPHKTKIALLNFKGDKYTVTDTLEVEYKGRRQEFSKAIGKTCPDIIYPNYGDYDYMKIKFDRRSLKNIQTNLSKIDDDFLRAMIWYNLWDMVRDQKLDVNTYLEVVKNHGIDEPLMITRQSILGKVRSALTYYFPRSQAWKDRRATWIAFFESAYMEKIKSNRNNPDVQKDWFDQYVSIVESQKRLDFLATVLRLGGDSRLKFRLDQDRRWKMLLHLAQHGHHKVPSLFIKEKKRDKSKRGEVYALKVSAAMPNLDSKKAFLGRVVDPERKDSLGNTRAIVESLFPRNQQHLHEKFTEDIYARLKAMDGAEDMVFASVFTRGLVPFFCNPEHSEKLNTLIEEKNLPAVVTKQLKITEQENARCIGIQDTVKKALKI